VTRNEVGFSDIFDSAKEISGVSWNNANSLFFGEGLIPYKGCRDFYLEEIKSYLEEDNKELIPPSDVDNSHCRDWFENNSTLAYQIIYQFMLKHEVEEMRVFGD